MQIQLKIIRCVTPKALRAERLSQREALPSQWAINQVSGEEQENWYKHYPKETPVLLTDEMFEDTVSKALMFVAVLE